MAAAEAPASRDETKRRTRAALVDAGIALFAEQGLDAPSLDAICERAGFTRGAFYVHFRDRDEFLEAVMERLGVQFLDAILGEGEGDGESAQSAARSAPEAESAQSAARSAPEAESAQSAARSAAGAEKPGMGLARTVARFLGAVAAGDYPLMREGGVRPHQLLDACARSKAIRVQYVRLAEESVARLAKIVRADQKAGTLRDDLDHRTVATLLLAAVIGAQTMNELKMKVDLPGAAAGLLRMLKRK